MQNVGQVLELGQSHAHQREQMHWARRGYHLDSQSLRLDVLDHAKEEIRSHYDTHVGRIDTLLLVLALIWPFALNVIQFSDSFIPRTAEECGECVEARHPWLVGMWIGLTGVILILPFWGILMLIRCKLKLDRWLERSLKGLNNKRRELVMASAPPTPRRPLSRSFSSLSYSKAQEEEEADEQHDDETQQVVSELVNLVMEYQEHLAQIWRAECGKLVKAAMMVLWMSALAALLLTSVSVWIFLVNKGGVAEACSTWFAAIILLGCLGPAFYVLLQRCCRPAVHREDAEPAPSPSASPQLLAAPSSPLLEPKARRARAAERQRSASFPALQHAQTTPAMRAAAGERSSPNLGRAEAAGSRRLGWCARRRRANGAYEDPLIPKHG